MDSADKNRERNTSQEWNDPAFSWDEMQAGIFDKIIEEEPDFFEEKPRRRVAIWFWMGAAALLIGGLCIWQFADISSEQTGGEKRYNPESPAITPTENQERKQTPIAEIPNEKTEIDFSENSREIQTSRTFLSGDLPLKNAVVNGKPVKEKTRTTSYIYSKNNDNILVESTETNTTLSLAPQTKQTEKQVLKIPDELSVALLPLEWNQSQPTLSLPAKRATNVGLPKAEETNPDDHSKHGLWKVAATGGSVLSFSKYTGNSAAVDLRNEHTSPYFGFQFGIDVAAPLSSKSHLFFGINRAIVYQNIDLQTVRQVEVLQEDVVVHVTHYVVGDRVSEVRGDTTLIGIERNRLVKYNEFKSAEIHAGYARDFKNEKWNFSPFAGMAVGMIDQQEGYTVASDKSIFSFDKDNPILNRFQLMSVVGVNVERKLAKEVSLLFQYRFDQQWNNASAEKGLTLRPANHYCSIGLIKQW